MQGQSPNSAGATYLDRTKRIAELREAAKRAAPAIPSLRRVILFGSLVSGIPTPRSDADILVVVEASPHRKPHERLPGILGALAPLPCPVDLFVLTSEELERGRAENAPLVRIALEQGIDILEELR